MKVLVTVKRAINPETKVKLVGDKLDLSGAEYVLNYFDEYAVEEAIRLRDGGKADEVIVVSVGSDEAQKELRTALAVGADRAILVKVDDDDELDTLGVAKILAAIVEKEQPGLVLMGKLSVDSENNQVGQMLGALTGMPQGTFAHSLALDGDWAVVGREVDGGTADVRIKLPAIVTADLRLNEPRYANLPGIMKAKKKQLDVIDPDDLDIELEAKVTTLGYERPPERKAGVTVPDVDSLIAKLRNEAKVI
ncbi:MAG: electron transfer flavoprotein subunit beta/FixA family protein [Myxococcales bacterium]|nr:electron transfer flavoprotein subunit beta/FixA family protein [Myxococcales bacterium]MCB9519757.1 electron transfer flavoprotein subunit beta/FixA family protein [Myxococcales bacterium]MCB9530449.1 electron transfer flavoprotein subunit beta/FixA family protein [Myxococcales bacterium]